MIFMGDRHGQSYAFDVNPFNHSLERHGLSLRRGRLQTLQINVGRKCNQSCRHCHVDASPWRTEMMSESIAARIVDWIREHRPPIVDITGGAPELSEHFCHLVEAARDSGCHVIDRNNLTIIETSAFGWLPEYLARHQVEIIASLPCYSPGNVNAQRGEGVFERSIAALKKLNSVGYGANLPLNLVFNPLGARLPGSQVELETDYKQALLRDHGIVFNKLFAVTNQPIARFAEDLRQQGQWDAYLELLANNFNPATVEGLMCRSTVSVGMMGEVFDCDFNQMLKMRMSKGKPLHLWDVTPKQLEGTDILTAVHCLACTAGCGSSCTGAVISAPSTEH